MIDYSPFWKTLKNSIESTVYLNLRYYWDGENFREYGALEIDDEDLLEIEGTEELLNYILSEDATINEIFLLISNPFALDVKLG